MINNVPRGAEREIKLSQDPQYFLVFESRIGSKTIFTKSPSPILKPFNTVLLIKLLFSSYNLNKISFLFFKFGFLIVVPIAVRLLSLDKNTCLKSRSP